MAEADLLRELTEVIASGNAVLFTGAGFSAEARDGSERPLPDSREMASDLWTMSFADLIAPRRSASGFILYDAVRSAAVRP